MALNAFGRTLVAAGLLLAVAIGAIVGLKLAGAPASPVVRMAIMLPVLAAPLWLGGRYWAKLDEVAREAQKAAWFWGGSFGSLVGFMAIAIAAQAGWAPAVTEPGVTFLMGGVTVVVAQILGFLLAWAIWWARR